jgi:hypothetical protein
MKPELFPRLLQTKSPHAVFLVKAGQDGPVRVWDETVTG